VVHSNTFTGTSYNDIIIVANFRDTNPYADWGQCNGTSSYDENQVSESGYACIDQIGRGKGDLMNQFSPPLPVAWPNQALEPQYQWDNPYNGTPYQKIPGTVHIVADRDFYEDTASFDGTVGMGVGVIVSRPSTCTPDVAYWATDEGNWWAVNPGPDGRLYKCTATDTWTLFYTPFTYPHPLQGEAGGSKGQVQRGTVTVK
jgi:hypothetical protein